MELVTSTADGEELCLMDKSLLRQLRVSVGEVESVGIR